jgi:hypothetical protein
MGSQSGSAGSAMLGSKVYSFWIGSPSRGAEPGGTAGPGTGAAGMGGTAMGARPGRTPGGAGRPGASWTGRGHRSRRHASRPGRWAGFGQGSWTAAATARAVVRTQRSNSALPCVGSASVTSLPQTPVSLTWSMR